MKEVPTFKIKVFRIKAKKYKFSSFPPEGVPNFTTHSIENSIKKYYKITDSVYCRIVYLDGSVSVYKYTGDYWLYLRSEGKKGEKITP